MAGNVYSVTQVTDYIQNMFAQDFMLERISVRGEIYNCKYHSSGHVYFTLKDEGAVISCILFAGSRSGLKFTLSEGMRVVASGRIGVYRKGGSYNLYVTAVTADGIGALYERYEKLKRELEEMGMFDEVYKKPIPKYINTLGIVTAPTGAAVRDIIQIAKRRHPGIRILLYPAKVQGEGAAQSIARGIAVMENAGVDVIIAGRGGGSIEDLWAFNEEITAKAFFSCSVPIISAVGHETDTVITDYVADLRAPTPSAASELAVPDMTALCTTLQETAVLMRRMIAHHISGAREKTSAAQRTLMVLSPGHRIAEMRLRLEDASVHLQMQMKYILSEKRNACTIRKERLEALSVRNRLSGGMALVQKADGKLLAKAEDAAAGDDIRVIFADGSIRAKVTETAHGR